MSTAQFNLALLAAADLPAVGPHRHRDAWEVAQESDDNWLLKVPNTTENTAILGKLPCLQRWHLEVTNKLVPFGKSLPNKALPSLSWLPVSTILPVIPERSQTNEQFFGHVSFSLVPASQPREIDAIRLPFSDFASWAELAPAFRLHRLNFALSSEGLALVLGTPPPPLPAECYYLCGKLLIPSGYGLPNHLSPHFLEARSDHYLLVEKDSSVHSIGAELLVPATRSSVRLTSGSFSGHG